MPGSKKNKNAEKIKRWETRKGAFLTFISSDFYRPNNKQICLIEGAN